MNDLDRFGLVLSDRRNLIAPLQTIEVRRVGLTAGSRVFFVNMLQRIPSKPADPAEKRGVHRFRGFAEHQQHGAGVCIHLLVEGRVHERTRSRHDVYGFAVAELCLRREDSAIGGESKSGR